MARHAGRLVVSSLPPLGDEPGFHAVVQIFGGARRIPPAGLVRDTLGRETLSPKEADAWLRALNDLRLVLGTRLDVSEDVDFEDLDLHEPRGRDLAVYAYLSWLQEELIEALAEE